MPDQQSFLPSAEESLQSLAALLGKETPTYAPKRAPHATDAVWDALVRIVGWQPEPRDDGAARRFGKVVNELHAMGATPEAISDRASRYKNRWPGVVLSPEAFLKHWSSLAPMRRATPLPERPTHELDELLERDGETMTVAEWKDRMATAGAAYLERAKIEQGQVASAVTSMMRHFGEMPG